MVKIADGTRRQRRTAREPVPLFGGALVLEAVFTPERGGGWSCSVPALPGCLSCGDTLEEARAMVAEAAELHLECLARRFEEERAGAAP